MQSVIALKKGLRLRQAYEIAKYIKTEVAMRNAPSNIKKKECQQVNIIYFCFPSDMCSIS